jgi:hypothetical protein
MYQGEERKIRHYRHNLPVQVFVMARTASKQDNLMVNLTMGRIIEARVLLRRVDALLNDGTYTSASAFMIQLVQIDFDINRSILYWPRTFSDLTMATFRPER